MSEWCEQIETPVYLSGMYCLFVRAAMSYPLYIYPLYLYPPAFIYHLHENEPFSITLPLPGVCIDN